MKGMIFNKRHFLFLYFISVTLLSYGCGSSDLPVDQIHRTWKNVPTYSVILHDMKEEGNFFTSYYHQYRIVQPETQQTTEWYQVPEDYYRRNEPFLGMAIASKDDGVMASSAAPPAYHYVGNPHYGQWRTDSSGTFWEFYGKYRLFSDVLGALSHRVYQSDYEAYRGVSSRNIPYYGMNNEFGTNGAFAKKTNPGFFERRMAREQLKKASFASRVSERIGRSRTGFRSRSGGSGK